jgi:adenylate cyclase
MTEQLVNVRSCSRIAHAGLAPDTGRAYHQMVPLQYVPTMRARALWDRSLEGILSIGETPGESESRRSGRRVFMFAFVLATALSIPPAIQRFGEGYPWAGVTDLATTVIPVFLLVLIAIRPSSYVPALHVMLIVLFAGPVIDTALFGGLLPSGIVVIFGLDIALGALLAIGIAAGLIWSGVFVLSVVYAVLIPNWLAPIYTLKDPTGDAAFSLIATAIVTVAVMIYFVRQRDLYQRRSDDLLHAILPKEIASRLKDEPGTIAADVSSASVLFADVVDFTPMSASMAPGQLVHVLDELFGVLDGFVAELGLEKIKTIGDAYMVAAGVPEPRPDHAHAIAELALRIRDHGAIDPESGRPLRFRIGIASGPVTAGVIGKDKFAYDLWGDTVNTASRMESSGVPGAIQITGSTVALLGDAYVCEPRGSVEVKGKGQLDTFMLVGRREETELRAGG